MSPSGICGRFGQLAQGTPAAQRSHQGLWHKDGTPGARWGCGSPQYWQVHVMAWDAQTCGHGVVHQLTPLATCRSGTHRTPLCPACSQVAPLHLGHPKSGCWGGRRGEERLLTQPPATGSELSQISLYTVSTALGWQGRRRCECPS